MILRSAGVAYAGASVPLVGRVNEGEVEVNGNPCQALLDSGAQVGNINEQYCRDHGIEYVPVKEFFHFVGTGGFNIPYLGVATVELTIPSAPSFKEWVPLMVLPTSKFERQAPVALGTSVLDLIISDMKEEELEKASQEWKTVHGSLVLSAEMAQSQGIRALDKHDCKIVSSERIVIAPFDTCTVAGKSHVKDVVGQASVMMEGSEQGKLPEGLEVTPTLGTFTQGSNQVDVGLRNLTSLPITLEAGRLIANATLCEEIPDVLSQESMRVGEGGTVNWEEGLSIPRQTPPN